MLECLKKKDNKDTMELQSLWEEGKYCVEGDSNIALMNVKMMIHSDAFNIGMGGDVPQGVIDQFPDVRKRHETEPIEKAYIQIGGNVWILGDCNMAKFLNDMRIIIQLYKQILSPENIVIASLPWTNPELTLGDRFGNRRLNRIKLVDLFAFASVQLAAICNNEGVKFLDIFNPLRLLWNKDRRTYYWDDIHYALPAQMIIGGMIRTAWGL